MKTLPHVRHHSIRGGFMKGCLIVVGIMALGCVILGIVVALKWKGWAAQATIMVAETAIKNSGLPAAHQGQMSVEIRKLADDFQSGRLSTADLEKVMRSVANGPLIPAAVVLSARQKYIEPSDMSPAEKIAATLAVQRYARGLFEKKLSTDSVKTVTESLMVSPGGPTASTQVTDNSAVVVSRVSLGSSSSQNNLLFKDHVTRTEIDRFVTLAKQLADSAGIPDQSFEPDWAVELQKAIGAALKGP